MSLASSGPILLTIISVLLIVGGMYLTWRDMRGKRPPQPQRAMPPPITVPAMPPSGHAVLSTRTQRTQTQTQPAAAEAPAPRRSENRAEVTIVHREPAPPPPATVPAKSTPGSAFGALQSAIDAIAMEAAAEKNDTATEGQRWPSVESRWLQVDALLGAAIHRINATLAPIALQIGQAGEASWNFKNRGFGAYRRIELSGRSIGWLRADINQEQQLALKVRAHEPQMALLNATTHAPLAHFDALQALEALSIVIKPAAATAAWAGSRATEEAGGLDAGWREVATIANEAFAVAGGALKEVGARLTEAQRPAWDAASGRHRWPLAVTVQGAPAAAISVDLVKRGLEIASTMPAGRRADLGRRRRLDIDGLTSHGLAEAIAACAWPAVADALERMSEPTP